MAIAPLNAVVRNIPHFAVGATLNCADERQQVVAVLTMFDRSLTPVSMTLWAYNVTVLLPALLRFGAESVAVPNSAEYWQVTATLAPPDDGIESGDMFNVRWRVAL